MHTPAVDNVDDTRDRDQRGTDYVYKYGSEAPGEMGRLPSRKTASRMAHKASASTHTQHGPVVRSVRQVETFG